MEPRSQLEEDFLVFDKENPEVWAWWEKFSREAIRAGFTILSAGMVAERIRWEASIKTNSTFKLPNYTRAYYARKWNAQHGDGPQFNTARVKGDRMPVKEDNGLPRED